ncbi:hypothetical protein C8R42DRAFT_644545 [Lentinula raphanica]|nr:hypothetical protein C8R42DRAFT_644545 [Lentinula raphanica]KAJ3816672.1 hypothetical protein F5880DRAFT_1512453 [Lentinula raphanica]
MSFWKSFMAIYARFNQVTLSLCLTYLRLDEIGGNMQARMQHAVTSIYHQRSISGPYRPNTVEKVEVQITDEEKERLEQIERRTSSSEIIHLHDFEVRKSDGYSLGILLICPAADDEITIRENYAEVITGFQESRNTEHSISHSFSRIRFRTWILRDGTDVDFFSTIS